MNVARGSQGTAVAFSVAPGDGSASRASSEWVRQSHATGGSDTGAGGPGPCKYELPLPDPFPTVVNWGFGKRVKIKVLTGKVQNRPYIGTPSLLLSLRHVRLSCRAHQNALESLVGTKYEELTLFGNWDGRAVVTTAGRSSVDVY